MADDPLLAALAEAESFMESLGGITGGGGDGGDNGSGSPVGNGEIDMDGFAIDSDDDEDGGTVVLNRTSAGMTHPLADLAVGTNERYSQQPQQSQQLLQQQQPQQQQVQNATSHHASMDLLKASTSRFASNLATMAQRAATTAVNTVAAVPQVSSHPLAGTKTTADYPTAYQPVASPINSNTNLPTSFLQTPPLPSNSNPTTSLPNNTTTGNNFFSSFPNPLLMGISTPGTTGPIMSQPQQQQQYQQHPLGYPQQKQATAKFSPSGIPTGMTSQQSQQPQQLLQNQQQGQAQAQATAYFKGVSNPTNSNTTVLAPQPPASMSSLDLDKEQKTELIQNYVGDLIFGEHVILFLTNLLHVSDSCSSNHITSASSSMTYHHQPHQPHQQQQQQKPLNLGWCCALTYYRIILFNTAANADESTCPELRCPPDWNKACWPIRKSETVIQIPLACIEKIERSTFTTTMTGAPNMMTMNNNGQGMILSQTPTSTTTTIVGLLISSKLSARQIKISTSHQYADIVKFHETLSNYAFPGRRNLGYLFAFECKREIVMKSIITDPNTGKKTLNVPPYRKRFDAIAEYQRQLKLTGVSSIGGDTNNQESNDQGIQDSSPHRRPWSIWTTTNQMYQLCTSYPNVIVGPTSLNFEAPLNHTSPNALQESMRIIRQCAMFRSENRLPALSWTSPDGSGGSLWRCSQPKTGLQGNRSPADEVFLRHILECSAAANNQMLLSSQQHQSASIPTVSRQVMVHLTGSMDLSNWTINDRNTCGLKIMDLRPRSSAMANRTQGYGYELTSNYVGTTLQFCNIGNIHTVRDSYSKLCNLCHSYNPSYDINWNNALEDTKWLSYIRLILSASWEAAYWVYIYKLPVLLHCSHGWDRTSQVVALAQLLLDPYYRTMAGFSCLIEKDFMSFGHPFHMRSGHGEGIGPAGTPVNGSNNNSTNSSIAGVNNTSTIIGSSHSSGSSASISGGGPILGGVVTNNPLFNTIQQHTGNLASTFAAATGVPMPSSSSTASSPSSGGSPFGGGGGGNSYSSNNSNQNNASGTGATGGASSSYDETQISPIFLQFLDCVYQLVELFPEVFEFNTRYLLLLSEHIYSCRFGNFLCDTERERETVTGIRSRTTSVWDYLESRPDVYNKQYSATNNQGVLLMPLPVLLRNVRLWTDRHCYRNCAKPTMRYVTSPTNYDSNFSDSESFSGDMETFWKFAHQEQMPLTTYQDNQRILLAKYKTQHVNNSNATSTQEASTTLNSNPVPILLNSNNDPTTTTKTTDDTVVAFISKTSVESSVTNTVEIDTSKKPSTSGEIDEML